MKVPYYRRLCILLFLGWAVLYANRAVLPVLLSALARDWQLSHTQMGLINSAFFLAYALAQLPSGHLADCWKPRPVMLAGYALQGAAGLGAATAAGPLGFTAWRALSGLGQGSYYASQYALAAGAIPPGRRGTMMAFINAGMAAGTIGGLVLTGWLVYTLGWHWRTTLALLGGTGLTLTAIMAVMVQADHGQATHRDRESSGRELPVVAVTAFFTMYGLYTLLTWTPYYLQEVQGLSGQASGLWTAVVPALAIPAGLLAGWGSDRHGRFRVLLVLVPVAGAAVFLVSLPGIAWVVLGLALYGMTGKLVLDPILIALLTDTVSPGARGRAFAVLNLASAAAAVVAPALTGALADMTDSFVPGLALAAALHGPAWVLLWRMQESRRGSIGSGTTSVCSQAGDHTR
ncbi:MAG: MFS transporter [Bacillota bacterium]